jgi:hypothetical protein
MVGSVLRKLHPAMAIRTRQPISVSHDGSLVDVLIGLRSVRHDGRGNTLFTASGTHDGLEVGLSVVLTGNMRPGFVNDQVDSSAVYPGGLVLMSDGETSDRLVATLSGLYGVRMEAARMIEQLPLTCVATHGDPRRFAEKKLRFKVFVGDESEGTYAEWFFHLNHPEGWIAVSEKDIAYRPNLISSLVVGA